MCASGGRHLSSIMESAMKDNGMFAMSIGKPYLHRNRRKGFTIVEVLIVAALLSTVGLALFNTFANGLKIWERGYRSSAEEDIFIFFDKITADLKNAFVYSVIPLKGAPDSLTFATAIRTMADTQKNLGEDYVAEIGSVEYSFDRVTRRLYRRQANYGQAVAGTRGVSQILVRDIDSATFRYYYTSGEGYVAAQGAKHILPSIVEVEVAFREGRGQRTMVWRIDMLRGS